MFNTSNYTASRKYSIFGNTMHQWRKNKEVLTEENYVVLKLDIVERSEESYIHAREFCMDK